MSIKDIATQLAKQAVETAAPLAEGQYDWYTYTGSRGMKITNSRGNREVTLRNNSKFGVRPATSGRGKTRIITEELGPTIVFSFDEEIAAKIIAKSTRANVRVTPKVAAKAAPKAPSKPLTKEALAKKLKLAPGFEVVEVHPDGFLAITKVKARNEFAVWFKNELGHWGGVGHATTLAAAKRQMDKLAASEEAPHEDSEAAAKVALDSFLSVVNQLDAARISADTSKWLRTVAKQAAKIGKTLEAGKDVSKLLANFPAKSAPKRKGLKGTDNGTGNLKQAATMDKFIPAVAKKWKREVQYFSTIDLYLTDLADYVDLAVALRSGNVKAIHNKASFDTDVREQLPQSVWNWLGKQGRIGY